MRKLQQLLQTIQPYAEELASEIASIEFTKKDKLISKIKDLVININETYFYPTIKLPDFE